MISLITETNKKGDCSYRKSSKKKKSPEKNINQKSNNNNLCKKLRRKNQDGKCENSQKSGRGNKFVIL